MQTELTVPPPESTHKPPSAAMRDFASQMLMADPETMKLALTDYQERRGAFREWLLSQLIRGTHFGFPPGCSPKWCLGSGAECLPADATHTIVGFGNKAQIVPLTQWTPKPSFYLAGADFVCNMLFVRAEYSADLDAWKMLSDDAESIDDQGRKSIPPKLCVMRCKLFSKITNEFIGEGLGARRFGTKGGDHNNTIKMAQKSAKVAAVLDAYGLRDLFTQDLEDGQQPPHDNPDPDPSKPAVPPRSDRCSTATVTALVKRWKSGHANENFQSAWPEYVRKNCGRVFNCLSATAWFDSDAKSIDAALKIEGL